MYVGEGILEVVVEMKIFSTLDPEPRTSSQNRTKLVFTITNVVFLTLILCYSVVVIYSNWLDSKSRLIHKTKKYSTVGCAHMNLYYSL